MPEELAELTCNKSSKSRPANFFIADTLLPNPRMVSLPNLGTCRYLGGDVGEGIQQANQKDRTVHSIPG
jgi:hypothetical protein